MEPLIAVTAQQKYEELINTHTNTEFKKTLMALNDACNKIEKIKGKMSYAAVASIAGRHLNAIKGDKEGHRAYVKLRQSEYDAKRKSIPARQADEQETVKKKPHYPASDLDPKTKIFIDGLWQEIGYIRNRNSLLEKTLAEVRKDVLNQTREKPLDARKMLRSGPDITGSMAIVVAGVDVPMIPLTPKLRDALEQVLKLGGHHKYLCLENGGLMLKTPSRDFLLLYPRELQAISEAIGKEVLSSEQELGTL
ncbi:MAG: hypothetical protein IPQ16_06600 [Geobacteraceae bacterium]|nr:hypothetical protein [Geobacteraceae bacterium]